MYHQAPSAPYLSQPTASNSPNHRLSPRTPSNSTRQHAFGSDTEHESSDSEDDDSAGFQVYKDNSSTSRYGHLPVASPTVRSPTTSQTPLNLPQNLASNNRNTPALLPPNNYNYPPPDHINSPNKPPNYNRASNPIQELVSIPALGSDWHKNESKKDKHWEGKDTFIDKNKWNQRKDKIFASRSDVDHTFRDFLAGRRNLAGWFNRFMALGLLIFCLIFGALLLFLLVPRIPTLAYDNQKPLAGDSTNGLNFGTQEPVKFNFNGNLNLAMIAQSSYVKPKISKLDVFIEDLNSTSSTILVATGSFNNHISISTKEYTPFSVDLKFSYSGSSKTDPVWTTWHEACGHKWPGRTDRLNLVLGIIVEFSVMGRMGTFSERTIMNNVTCPVELSASAA